MASLADLKPVIREAGLFRFARKVWTEVGDDHVFIYASALSYSWLFAFFPMLVFLVSLIPFLPHDARVKAQAMIFDSIQNNFPQQTADWILNNSKLKSLVDATLNEQRGAVLSISLLVALWAASNGLGAVMTAMDRCYEIDKGRPFYRSKPLSLLLTVVLTGLVLVVMTVIPVATFVEHWVREQHLRVPFTDIHLKRGVILAFNVVRYSVGLASAFLILSIVYHFCPSVKMRWRFVTPGAMFCFLAWVAIGAAFKIYFAMTGGTTYSQTFGPAAGLAVLLLIFYLYGVALLIGAEINSEVDYLRLGAPPGTRDLRPYERELAARGTADDVPGEVGVRGVAMDEALSRGRDARAAG